MHDLHLANQIVKLAKKYAGGKPIKSIAIELGDILEHGENITAENLRYNINLLLSNIDVIIKKINGPNWKITEIEII